MLFQRTTDIMPRSAHLYPVCTAEWHSYATVDRKLYVLEDAYAFLLSSFLAKPPPPKKK
jgi:hypothetical protein